MADASAAHARDSFSIVCTPYHHTFKTTDRLKTCCSGSRRGTKSRTSGAHKSVCQLNSHEPTTAPDNKSMAGAMTDFKKANPKNFLLPSVLHREGHYITNTERERERASERERALICSDNSSTGTHISLQPLERFVACLDDRLATYSIRIGRELGGYSQVFSHGGRPGVLSHKLQRRRDGFESRLAFDSSTCNNMKYNSILRIFVTCEYCCTWYVVFDCSLTQCVQRNKECCGVGCLYFNSRDRTAARCIAIVNSAHI